MTENYDAPYLDEAEHASLDHSGIPGVGGGGSSFSPNLLTDYVYWSRLVTNGTPEDEDTGGLDYIDDLQQEDPAGFIVVDEDPDWVSFWDYPSPVVTADGWYVVRAWMQTVSNFDPSPEATDGEYAKVDVLYWLDGVDGSYADSLEHGDKESIIPTANPNGHPFAQTNATLWLPAGTHIEPVFNWEFFGTATINQVTLNLRVTRIQ